MTPRATVALALALVIPAAARADVAFFEAKVRPVLVKHCYECHSAKKARGGLRLDTRDGTRKGGESGPVIVPGKPAESALLKALRHAEGAAAMPPAPRPKLPAAIVADIEKWIATGAPDPRTGAVVAVPDAARKHW